MGFQYNYYIPTAINNENISISRKVKSKKRRKNKFSQQRSTVEKRSKLNTEDLRFLESIGLKLKI